MKKIIGNNKIYWIVIILLFLSSCEDFLKEEVYTQYDPATYLQTESGINSILVAAYSNMQVTSNMRDRMYTLQEFPGDIMWEWGGSFAATAVLFMNFNWDSQSGMFSTPWQQYYVSIRNANSLLDNIDNVTAISPDKVKQFKAEARFILAADYYYLWEIFGPVPLITTASELNFEPVRATDQEFDTFITGELQAAASDLPLTQSLWGKATKGAALALLSKYYMNTHQWQNAADVSQQVIDLNKYKLFTGDIVNMFAVVNEVNDEVILTSPSLPTIHGNVYMAHAFPPNYQIQSNWINYGAQFCVYNNWVTTYDPVDKRLGWFLFSYTEKNGTVHDLLNPADAGKAVRCFKYVPDPDGVSQSHGNDVPMIRYAEVLLNRSEALNELNGPTQEAVDLLNQIRTRAGVPLYNLSDFASKDAMRDALLNERGWEFVAEGLRRMDLIRQGKLISRAIARGATNAKDYMTRYPIPLNEIKANPNLVQNTGY
ncbi:MAG TPA: RagB/SusD family nutrient uptake outer membrane protein [Bacteroidales bacterium]|nr:RagB/SusD family nutrient uptake outer membrane protein [Bacteroidales bacterium]